MKSVLPPVLEKKRYAIMKSHNRRTAKLIFPFMLFLVLLAVAAHPAAGASKLTFAVITLALIAGGFLAIAYFIQRGDDRLCREMAFICPHCQKPLYDARGLISVTGRCPHCKESVVS